MKCCGKNRTSKFCPECGAAITASPLLTLLAHVRLHIASMTTNLDRMLASDDEDYMKRGIERSRKAITKWQVWEQSLVEAIEREGRP